MANNKNVRLDQKDYSSDKIDLSVWKRLVAYALRRKATVVRRLSLIHI